MTAKPAGSAPADQKIDVMFSAAEVAHRVTGLAGDIARDLGEEIVVVAILKGSFIFAADLLRALHHEGVRPRVDFMTLASYGSAKESSGSVEVRRDITEDVAGQTVLLVDDILESGRTLAFARELLAERGAARVTVCVLLEKPGKRAVEIDADFCGFKTPDQFVVGYGLDYDNHYRELPYIGVLAGD